MLLPAARIVANAAWPTALIPSLRMLWTRTLFPGAVEVDPRIRWRSLAALIFLPALFLYPWLNYKLLEPDEGRYAEIGREMLMRGDWIVPHLQGEPYLDKPPLLYWAVMASYRIFGVHDWSARIPPALAVHGTILLTYLFGRRLLGERAAVRGALLLSLTPGLMGMGRLLVLDGLLTFWVTLGLFAGYEAIHGLPRRRIGFEIVCAIACGLGVLTKGPVAIVLVLVPNLAFAWFTYRAIPKRAAWPFFTIVTLINAPWYIAVWLAQPEFGLYFFVKHNLQRYLMPFDHLEPIWYYVPILLGGLLPITILGWSFLRWLIAGGDAARQRTVALGFCLLAGGWCVLFFSLSGSKLPTYIMPAFAPLALAFGYFWTVQAASGVGRWFAWLVGVWSVFMLLACSFALPWYAEQRSPMGAPAADMRALCGDPTTAVCCYPRNCDSAAFYLGRDDLTPTRSKFVHLLVQDLLSRDRTVVLFTHNHSLAALKPALPPDLRIAREVSCRRKVAGPAFLTTIVGETPWGLCDIAVIERTRPLPPQP